MTTHVQPRNRLLYLLLGVVGALVVLCIALVVFRGPAPAPDPASPEGTVQRYTQALLAGDDAAASELLDPASKPKNPCTYPDSGQRLEQVRVTLDSSSITGQRASVAVMLSTGGTGGPFGSGESSYPGVFELHQVDGSWAITVPPWPLLVCGAENEVL